MHCVILGFGYSASAFARENRERFASVTVTARSDTKVAQLRREGWQALRFDGAEFEGGLVTALQSATHLLVSIPPDETGDPVIRYLGRAIRGAPTLARVFYLSTVGVYGDQGGAWVDETSPLRPISPRSRQRVAAEEAWQAMAAQLGFDFGIFRLSGIYGPGRSAIDNLRAGTARRIIKPGQVFNRIHVSDIAGALGAAITSPEPLGTFNLTDDEPAPPQDVVAYGAGLLGVPVPPDLAFENADLSPMGRSFYGENKRVSNARIKQHLGYRFRCPTYREGLAACL